MGKWQAIFQKSPSIPVFAVTGQTLTELLGKILAVVVAAF
jgi:hypothetical protein